MCYLYPLFVSSRQLAHMPAATSVGYCPRKYLKMWHTQEDEHVPNYKDNMREG